ncbi:MAG: ester cyclase [Pseudomonadota bacterium]
MTTTTALNQANKQLVWDFWRALDTAPPSDSAGIVARYATEGTTWHGPDPVNDLQGSEAYASVYWQPLRTALSDFRRQTHVFFGGPSSGRIDGTGDGHLWVGGTGLFSGTFEKDFLGIAATGKPIDIRWGEFCKVEDNRIVESFYLLDMIDFLQQAGIDLLPPARGADGIYPPPEAGDGLLFDALDEAQSAHTLAHIRRFIFDGLNAFDENDLTSMGMAGFFHPQVKWYGPGGIGACLSFEEFENHHQKRWLHAYPDRRVQDLDALIAEGPYSGGPGWAGVNATHTGEYLGYPATNRPVSFNGLDYWKLENDRYVENWVFVDMIHLFRQLVPDFGAGKLPHL